MKNNKGQTLYYFMVLILIVIISWAMMLNISMLIIERMKMQNEADNIAYNLAVQKARVYNTLGGINYLIGSVLSLAMDPFVIQFPSYSTQFIGGMPATMMKIENPLSDLEHSFGKSRDKGANLIKETVEILQKTQSAVMTAYAAQIYETIYEYNKGDYNMLILSLPEIKDLAKPEKYLGLKKNSKGVKYAETDNYCINNKVHFHFLKTSDAGESDYSWLVEDENFHEQKIVLVLRKKPNEKKTVFARLLDIKFPELIAYSAAAPYNVKGSMFPKQESEYTGLNKETAAVSELSSALQYLLMAKAILEAKNIPYLGTVIAALGEGFLAAAKGASLIHLTNIKTSDNPIDTYLKARAGGWAAHLIPYKTKEDENQ